MAAEAEVEFSTILQGLGYRYRLEISTDLGYLHLKEGHSVDYSVQAGELVLDFSRIEGLVGIEILSWSDEMRKFFGLGI